MQETTTQTPSADQQLDEVTINQLTWKPSVIRSAAVAIARASLLSPLEIYPEDVAFCDVVKAPINVNCIGIAFRTLIKAGVVRRSNRFRRSKQKSAKGRTVFAYELASEARAKTFLSRNDENDIPGQQLTMSEEPASAPLRTDQASPTCYAE